MTITTDIHAAIAAITQAAVYPIALPQTVELPAVTYQIISTVRVQHQEGDSKLPTRRVQFDAYALTYAEVEQIAHQIVGLLKDGTPTLGMTIIQHASISNEYDDYDPLTGRYRRIIDTLLTYQEG